VRSLCFKEKKEDGEKDQEKRTCNAPGIADQTNQYAGKGFDTVLAGQGGLIDPYRYEKRAAARVMRTPDTRGCT
jgi:hypothetical protein